MPILLAHRDRPIRLERWPLGPTEPTGIWIATTHFDAFITREDAQPIQREASLLHESAHMLLGHGPDDSNGALDFASKLAPSLDPQLVRHIMSRHSYDCPIERDAELCATHLAVAVRRTRREFLWADQASTRMR